MKDLEIITTIQELLQGRNEDFDRAARDNKVKLVRHADRRTEWIIKGERVADFPLYDMYIQDKKKFLDYQSEQVKKKNGNGKFDDAKYIVSFIGEEGTTSRFIGVYKNKSVLSSTEDSVIYDLEEVDDFTYLNEKIIIDWGPGTQSYIQNYKNEKKVLRIERGMGEKGIPYFKSYTDVNLPYDTLKKIIDAGNKEWKMALQAVNCIYMITDKNSPKQYIGQTSGKGGIWQRWSEYAKEGHGGDVDLKEIIEKDNKRKYGFSWIILEILPLNVTPREADKRESMYKEKFLTRLHGYNNN